MASELHRARTQAARSLSALVSEYLPALGIKKGALEIAVHGNAGRPSAHGTDHIEFNVRTNPGYPFAPLAKIASGGELSRIGLAIHVATASTAHKGWSCF